MLPGRMRTDGAGAGEEGQPPFLELVGEQQDQHQAEPESRDGDAEEGGEGEGIVQLGVLAHRGIDAHGDGDHQGDDGRSAHEADGVEQPLADHDQHRPMLLEGIAEVAAQDALAIARVLRIDAPHPVVAG